ncbi:hypothetical protein Gasu2_04350 [Galdieria sulphuraria]|nr:hypothetical protein Gasu2_04350 [Galdieria sulphuraria]
MQVHSIFACCWLLYSSFPNNIFNIDFIFSNWYFRGQLKELQSDITRKNKKNCYKLSWKNDGSTTSLTRFYNKGTSSSSQNILLS